MMGRATAQPAILTGKLKPVTGLAARLHPFKTLAGRMSMPVGFEAYQGSYDVCPEPFAQTLATADKRMRQDVTVQAIPFYEVDNAQGGETIIIGRQE